MERVDRDDVGMPQLRQGVGLADHVGGDLQRDGPVGEIALPGQVDAAEGPPPQLGLEPEAEEHATQRGESRHGRAALRQVRVRPIEVPEELGRSRQHAPRRERGLRRAGSSSRSSRYSR